MVFEYNSRNEKYKTPFGAVVIGADVRFSVCSDADSVYILGFGDKQQMHKADGEFTLKIASPSEPGLVMYGFEAVWGGVSYYFGRSKRGAGAEQGGAPFQLTVHENIENPVWFCGSVIYQVYVDRFFKGDSSDTVMRDNVLMHTSWNDSPVYIKNEKGEIVLWDFFGGNLSGVIEKLDYIKSLGVEIIYLNPVFESVSNHKYDTADYNEIDRMYGTTETLKRLIDEAGKKGIKIMLDGVFSHTGDDSIYFNKYKSYSDGGAYNDQSSQYYDWYTFEDYPDKYDCWWGVTSLPCVNELSPSYIDYLLNEENGAVIKWMKLGIAGWRLDVADELPDAFIKKLKNAILKINPDAVLLGEVWEDASSKVSYDKQRKYILENSLDSVSNYPLRDSLLALLTQTGTPDDFAETVMTLQENYPRNVFLSLMNMTGTHDTTRLMTLLGDAPDKDSMSTWQQRDYRMPENKAALALQRLHTYFIVLFTLPGNPCIYYGDEIGLQGYEDPYNRGTFDWSSEQVSITDLIKQLSALRKTLNTKDGHVQFDCSDRLLRYYVCSGKSEYTVCINAGSRSEKVNFNETTDIVLMHNGSADSNDVILKPYGAAIAAKRRL